MASAKDADTLNIVPVEYLAQPSIDEQEAMSIDIAETWMTPIIAYLEHGVLPSDRNEAKKMMRRASRYLVMEGILNRRGYTMPLLRCVTIDQSKNLLIEVHEGFCGDHAGGQSLSKKILRQGFFWPAMIEDSMEYVKPCDKCQRFSKILRAPPNIQKQMQSP